MKINELLKVRTVLISIKQAKMPLKISYQFAKFLHDTDSSNEFYNEKYQEVINKYSQKDDLGNSMLSKDGQSIKIQQEFFDECVAAIKELEEIEIEVPKIKINLSELENIELTVDQVYALMLILEE